LVNQKKMPAHTGEEHETTMKGFLQRLAAATVFAGLAFASAAAGEVKKPLGVVELFTSQGCSSCPAADAIFADLVQQGDLVALAYHVDYWDYLGWQDTLATPDNTQRQYDYAKSFGAHSVYTPQAIINGRTHVRGSSRTDITDTLAKFDKSGEGMSVDIKVIRAGDSIVIDAGEGADDDEGQIVLVHFKPAVPVAIGRGENRGKTITYWNAVTAVQTLGMWHGAAARYELPASEVDKNGIGGCAVLLQAKSADGLPGPILGATLIQSPGN
jgi:hypothetical protein